MLGVVELAEGRPRCTADVPEAIGVRVEQHAAAFELSCDLPGGTPIYYRVGYGRLEWGTDLAAFLPADKGMEAPRVDPAGLLALISGVTPAPDATTVPGVRRLAVGTSVRVDGSGVRVSRHAPTLSARRRGLVEAIGAVLNRLPDDYAIAYSGGMSSAFLAICAIEAGHRPRLLHADLGGELSSRTAAAEIPGLRTETVRIDLSELLDHHRITGTEPTPPLPEIELPRQTIARLAEANDGTIASGAMLKELASARVADVGAGFRGWRLLTCEPFHVSGSPRTLREARDLMRTGRVLPTGTETETATAGARPASDDGPPWLTETGREALRSVRQSTTAVWKQHLDELPTMIGRLDAGVHERGLSGQDALPALDPGVLVSLAATRAAKLGGIRNGRLHNHLLPHRSLAAHKVTNIPATSPGFRIRLAAAAHLHRERDKVIAELTRECALADLGLIEPASVIDILRDGPSLADHALTLLRLVWVDQWLRGR